MIGLLAMTSGVFITGLGVCKYVNEYMRAARQTTTQKEPKEKSQKESQKESQHIRQVQQSIDQTQLYNQLELIDNELRRGLGTSSLSLGLASAGLLFFTPLRYASVPVLVYMGIPAAQDAYDILYIESRSSRALAETAVLMISLASGYYWVSSLGFFLYYAGRTLYHNRPHTDKMIPRNMWQVPRMARLLKATEEIAVQTVTLQPGDLVIVGTSEVVPGDGVITEGMALLKSSAMPNALGTLKQPGDNVGATDIILVGQICIQIQETS